MRPNSLTDLTEIWNQDFLGDDASFYKYLHSEKSDPGNFKWSFNVSWHSSLYVIISSALW